MKLEVNGETHELREGLTLQQALKQLGFTQNSYAVAVNLDFVPRSDYDKKVLREGDKVEVVTPRQGG